jgi:hypothetical protein
MTSLTILIIIGLIIGLFFMVMAHRKLTPVSIKTIAALLGAIVLLFVIRSNNFSLSAVLLFSLGMQVQDILSDRKKVNKKSVILAQAIDKNIDQKIIKYGFSHSLTKNPEQLTYFKIDKDNFITLILRFENTQDSYQPVIDIDVSKRRLTKNAELTSTKIQNIHIENLDRLLSYLEWAKLSLNKVELPLS